MKPRSHRSRLRSLFGLTLLLLAAGCGGGGEGSGLTFSSPTAPPDLSNIVGTWSGTQNAVSSTSGSLCVHQLLQNQTARGLSEPLQLKITQLLDNMVLITPTVSGKTAGSLQGRVNGSDFSASWMKDTGALGQPTFCSGTNYVLVEKGGALTGRVSSGTISGTGTRDFYITDKDLRELGLVTVTYEFSGRK